MKQSQNTAAIKRAAKNIIKHYDEFGAEYGFDIVINAMRELLNMNQAAPNCTCEYHYQEETGKWIREPGTTCQAHEYTT